MVVLHFLNFYDNSFFNILSKNIVLKVDTTKFGLKRLLSFDFIRLKLNAHNVFNKSLKHDFIGKGFFKENFVI